MPVDGIQWMVHSMIHFGARLAAPELEKWAGIVQGPFAPRESACLLWARFMQRLQWN
jgi:hypothetical protein